MRYVKEYVERYFIYTGAPDIAEVKSTSCIFYFGTRLSTILLLSCHACLMHPSPRSAPTINSEHSRPDGTTGARRVSTHWTNDALLIYKRSHLGRVLTGQT